MSSLEIEQGEDGFIIITLLWIIYREILVHGF